MEWILFLVVGFAMGVLAGMFAYKSLDKFAEEKANAEAAQAAAEARALSKLKRSQSAKNAALNRRMQAMPVAVPDGLGTVESKATLDGDTLVSAGSELAPSSASNGFVDPAFYGRKELSDVTR